MGGFSTELIGRSGYGVEGFAAAYDRHRPRPPGVLLDVLMRCAATSRPALVVDLGCGTGLSTRAWAGVAERTVGVEGDPGMAAVARETPHDPAIEFVGAMAHDTGLPTGAADIVTCAQSFHWMDPRAVLPEVARLLRPGGVFAAYDYDVVPVVEARVDRAFADHVAARSAARMRLGLEAGASRWPKETHVDRMRSSRLFARVREVHCHGEGIIDAEGLIGLAHSIGGPVEIFGSAAPEVGATLADLERVARDVLREPLPSLTGYALRIGTTPS